MPLELLQELLQAGGTPGAGEGVTLEADFFSPLSLGVGEPFPEGLLRSSFLRVRHVERSEEHRGSLGRAKYISSS